MGLDPEGYTHTLTSKLEHAPRFPPESCPEHGLISFLLFPGPPYAFTLVFFHSDFVTGHKAALCGYTTIYLSTYLFLATEVAAMADIAKRLLERFHESSKVCLFLSTTKRSPITLYLLCPTCGICSFSKEPKYLCGEQMLLEAKIRMQAVFAFGPAYACICFILKYCIKHVFGSVFNSGVVLGTSCAILPEIKNFLIENSVSVVSLHN